MTAIGFIGLGHMGAPMGANLVKTGHQVTVYDINTAAVETLVAAGARAAKSIADAARGQEIIFTMLQTGEQVRHVCLDADGIYAHASRGALHIDSSSIDVTSSRALHQAAAQAGLKSLDAPVSGGVGGATQGTLTFMVGGDVTTFEQALPILQNMGKKIVHAGPAGNGQIAKICNNMILGISMIGISEAFTLGEKLGLDPKKLFEISSNSSGQCWAMTNYAPVPNLIPNVPANNDYKPGFTASMMLKDLNLSQQAAGSIAFNTPLGAAATALYEQFVAQDQGNLDFSAIIKMLENS